MPVRLISRVRGMGVAVSVSTSTSARRALMDSLWLTPKRCSSSTTSRPRSLKAMSVDSSRWVPMTTSTSPEVTPAVTARAWAGVRKRLSTSTRTGYGGEALGEGLEVLLGQQGGGHQDGGLACRPGPP